MVEEFMRAETVLSLPTSARGQFIVYHPLPGQIPAVRRDCPPVHEMKYTRCCHEIYLWKFVRDKGQPSKIFESLPPELWPGRVEIWMYWAFCAIENVFWYWTIEHWPNGKPISISSSKFGERMRRLLQ